MLSDRTLERVSMSYAKGYRDGYGGRAKSVPANGISALNQDTIGVTIRPFADYDYEQGYSAGENDERCERQMRRVGL